MTKEKIKELRDAMGLTQEKFARKLGISWPTVSRWETGLRSPKGLYLKLLQRYARKHGVLCLLLCAFASPAFGMGDRAITYAVYSGFPSVVRYAIEIGADVNLADPDGDTALMIACRFGRAEMVDALLKAKANVNAQDAEGRTALMWAALRGEIGIVRRLLLVGADRTQQDRYGKTARDRAEWYGHREVVKALSV